MFMFERYEMKFSYTVLRWESSWIIFRNKVYDWFEECLEIHATTNDITSKYVPPRVDIFYCLGEITLVYSTIGE